MHRHGFGVGAYVGVNLQVCVNACEGMCTCVCLCMSVCVRRKEKTPRDPFIITLVRIQHAVLAFKWNSTEALNYQLINKAPG